MQTLLLGFDKTLADLTFSIYRLVIVNSYNLLVNFAEEINRFDFSNIVDTIRNNIYILLGIFMLFRLAISFINYMINPDAMGDKNAGTGKLVTRVVTSFVLLLALPLVFPLLRNLQSALIAPESGEKNFIERLIDVATLDYSTANDTLVFDNILYIDKVKAAETKICDDAEYSSGYFGEKLRGCRYEEDKLIEALKEDYLTNYSDCKGSECYFQECSNANSTKCYSIKIVEEYDNDYKESGTILRIDSDNNLYHNSDFRYTPTVYVTASNSTESKTLTCYYRMDKTAADSNSAGKHDYQCGVGLVRLQFNNSQDGTSLFFRGITSDKPTGWYVKSLDAQGSYKLFSIDSSKSTLYLNSKNMVDDLKNGTCPRHIDGVACDDSTCKTSSKRIIFSKKTTNSSYGSTFVEGTSDYTEFLSSINSCSNRNRSTRASDNIGDDLKGDLDNQWQDDLKNSCKAPGCDFARALLASYMYGKDKNEIKAIFNEWPTNSDDISLKIENGTYKYQTVVGLIVGLGLSAFLVTILVELIIRNFKLFILEAVAPIPAICYMNPNDKTFDNWVKQYIGVYLDIFIKLIAINIANILLQYVLASIDQLDFLETVLYVIAVIVFMKVIPDFISKIFGIKSMGGTMKQSFAMLKSAVSGAAGGVLGAGVALGSGYKTFAASKGQGFLNRTAAFAAGVGTLAGSTLAGLGSGSKGNITGGLKHATQVNAHRRGLYEQGYGAGSVMFAGLTKGLNEKDEKVENAFDDILKKRKVMDDRIEGEILKGKGGYRTSNLANTYYANGTTSERNVANELNGKSIQEIGAMLTNGTDVNGNELSADKVGVYKRIYADEMNSAKADYVNKTKLGVIDDVQTVSNMQVYDDTIDYYAKSLKKSKPSAEDPDYKYDFTQFISTNEIGRDGSRYKGTKGKVEDAKVVFSGSKTRRNHIKVSKK